MPNRNDERGERTQALFSDDLLYRWRCAVGTALDGTRLGRYWKGQ